MRKKALGTMILILLAVLPLRPDVGIAIISGQVVDVYTGKRIGGATISIWVRTDTITCYSRPDGAYATTVPAPGSGWTVEARATGYIDNKRFDIAIQDMESLTINFAMTPIPIPGGELLPKILSEKRLHRIYRSKERELRSMAESLLKSALIVDFEPIAEISHRPDGTCSVIIGVRTIRVGVPSQLYKDKRPFLEMKCTPIGARVGRKYANLAVKKTFTLQEVDPQHVLEKAGGIARMDSLNWLPPVPRNLTVRIELKVNVNDLGDEREKSNNNLTKELNCR